MNETTRTNSGVGFGGLLTILFIALKLTGYIAWSWWWVLAPLWIPAAVGLFIVSMALIVMFIKRGDR